MKDSCRIGVVILNYNSHKLVEQLLSDIENQTGSFEIRSVVVDNFSSQDELDKLYSLTNLKANVEVISSPQNVGYAQGNNLGLNYLSKEYRPDFLIVLNPDIRIYRVDCFQALIHSYYRLDSVGVLSPLQLDFNGKIVPLYSKNTFLDDVLNMFYLYRRFKTRTPLIDSKHSYEVVESSFVSGCFMFVSREIFKDIGFFDESTFLYCEERFVSDKIYQRGLKSYIDCNIEFHHEGSSTIDKVYTNLHKFRLWYTSILIYTRKMELFPVWKSAVLRVLIPYSLMEVYVISLTRNLLMGRRK